MKLISTTLLAVAGLTLGNVNGVMAQIPIGGPGNSLQSQPTVSPYLNLLRRNNSPTINYFGIVRPEVNFQSTLNALQQQVSFNQQSIGDLQSGGLPTTGHTAMFLNTGGYFPNTLGTGAASRTSQSVNLSQSSGIFGPSLGTGAGAGSNRSGHKR